MKAAHHILAAGILAAALAAPTASPAFQLSGYRWANPTAAFAVDIPGPDSDPDFWDRAFENAMAIWTTETAFEWRIARNTASDPCDNRDDRNGVRFATSDCGIAWGSTTLAITHTLFFPGSNGGLGRIDETDIVFNANESWNVFSGPSDGTVFDFQRVAIHEIGHAMGLGHEDNTRSIMSTFSDATERPTADDRSGIAALYGTSGGGGTAPPTPTPRCDRPLKLDIPASFNDILAPGCTVRQILRNNDDSFVDQYRIKIDSPGNLRITMRSNEFDTFIFLLDFRRRTVKVNDDGGAGTNSVLVVRNIQPGTYFILANAFSVGQSGPFQMRVNFSAARRTVEPEVEEAAGIETIIQYILDDD